MDRNLSASRPQVLGKNRTAAFPQARGLTMTCSEGEIWITEDGDLRDTVLRTGERITLEHAGRALVFALTDATFLVQAPIRPSMFGRVEEQIGLLFRALRARASRKVTRTTEVGGSSTGASGACPSA